MIWITLLACWVSFLGGILFAGFLAAARRADEDLDALGAFTEEPAQRLIEPAASSKAA